MIAKQRTATSPSSDTLFLDRKDMQTENRLLLPNVPVNELHTRFWKETNTTLKD